LRFVFTDKKLKALFYESKRIKKYRALEDAFFEVMDEIAAAADRRELYALTSRNFKMRKGKFKDEYSMRLTKQFRIYFEIEVDEAGEYLVIKRIGDEH
jgi:plasmid maintenance system killer protein